MAGETSCRDCPAGYACTSTTTSTPTQCTAGQYAAAQASSCSNCGSGEYSAAGSASCTQCPAGSKCATTSSTPVQCLKGTYAPAGSTSCTNCDIGHKCPSDGMSVPTPCPAGYYQTSAGQETCTQCPLGMSHIFVQISKHAFYTRGNAQIGFKKLKQGYWLIYYRQKSFCN